MAEKRQNEWLLQNSICIVVQQCQNLVSFHRNGSGVVLKSLLIISKGQQCFLFIREHFLSFKKCGENLNTILEPFLCELTLF